MIKPGTLCMIRGVPPGTKGGDCNGKVVVAVEKIYEDIWAIDPHLVSKIDGSTGTLIGSKEQYLHPFKDFDQQELLCETIEDFMQTTALQTFIDAFDHFSIKQG